MEKYLKREDLEAWIAQAERDPDFAKSGQLERWQEQIEALGPPITAEFPEKITVVEAPRHTLSTRLADRGVSEQTALLFGILANGNGWEYPVPNGGGSKRWKAYNSKQHPKYKWLPEKPETAEYYHADNLADAVRENAGACWMASGEPDVWALYSAGIEHVFSAGFGESRVPANLAEVLQSMGVLTLYIAPDLDKAGEKWARKVAARIKDSGIELDARKLPESLGKGGDLGQAWEIYTREGWPFERWLLGLPRTRIRPEPERKRTPPSVAAGEIPEAYRQSIADKLDVSGFGSEGFSKNLICPFHEETNPSANLHQTKGLYCHHSGQWYRWTDLGDKLGVGSLSEWIQANPDQGRFVVLSLSTETREALIKSGLTTIARLYDALYAAGLTPGSTFTTAQAAELCQPYRITRKSIYKALAKDSERDELFPFFPPLTLQHSQPEKKGNNSRRGPKDKVYKVLSPLEMAQLAGAGRQKYHHYDQIPAEKLAKISTYRAEVYAALPRRLPGTYSRKRLSSRLGVTPRTTQNYDKIADLDVQARFDREEMKPEDIEALHDDRKDAPAGVWLEDEKGHRYQPTKAGAAYAAKWIGDGKLYLVQQLANYYGPGRV